MGKKLKPADKPCFLFLLKAINVRLILSLKRINDIKPEISIFNCNYVAVFLNSSIFFFFFFFFVKFVLAEDYG